MKVIIWIHQNDQVKTDCYKVSKIIVTNKVVLLYTKDGEILIDRKIVSMIDFKSEGFKDEKSKNSN